MITKSFSYWQQFLSWCGTSRHSRPFLRNLLSARVAGDLPIVAITPSSLSSPVSMSLREMLSAGISRRQFGRGALMSNPTCIARATIAGAVSGATSSASRNPEPLVSPRPCWLLRSVRPSRKKAALCAAMAKKSGSISVRMTASPTAHTNGLPQ